MTIDLPSLKISQLDKVNAVDFPKNLSEFAAKAALAAVEPIPQDHTRYVGDVSDFLAAGR